MAETARKNWYIVHTFSGYENKVKASLDQSIINNGLQDVIDRVEIPMENVVEIKRGKVVTSERKRMPGYVLVHMEMNNRTWYHVRNIHGVSGFVSIGTKASILSDEEYEQLMSSIPVTRVDVQVGDDVQMLSGPF